MSVSPDFAAATFGGDSSTQSNDDVEALREMASAAGFQLVPMSEGQQASVESADPQTISAKIKRVAWLNSAATAAKAKSDSYTAQAEALKKELQDQMLEEEVARQTASGWTAYFAPTHKMVKTSDDVTTDDILKALRDSGQGQMVKVGYNYQTVQAYLKDLVTDGLEIPDALAKVVALKSESEVRLRRAGG
jgi:hypothetical protein